MVAPTPAAVLGRTMPRITSHRVAPSASAPSFSSLGTVRNRSRLSAEMIGRIITVSTSTAVNTLIPVVEGLPNRGMNPSTLCKAGLEVVDERYEHHQAPEAVDDAGDGREHLDQRANHARTRVGAIMLRYRPIPIPRGVASTSAPIEVTNVP